MKERKKNNSYELRKEELRQQKKQERSQMSRKERKEQSKLEKKEKKKKREVNKEFARVTYVFVALFLVLMGYIGYFIVVESEDIINSPYNPRLDSMADRVVREKYWIKTEMFLPRQKQRKTAANTALILTEICMHM